MSPSRSKICCPHRIAGPEAAYARNVLLDEGNRQSVPEEMPCQSSDPSLSLMNGDGRYSFKELAAETGVSVNTLLSRKHYAVLHLRSRLQSIYEEFVKE